MPENRMLVVDAELVKKLDENRGDLSRSDFINLLIDNQLKEKEEVAATPKYVSKEEFDEFAQGMRQLLRHFLDFFISYGIELGEEPKDQTFEELVQKMQVWASKKQSHKIN